MKLLAVLGRTRSPKFSISRAAYSRDTDFDSRNKENTPCAADVLYKNPEAIANRLRLYHLYRLQRQLHLDHRSLKNLAQSVPQENDEKEISAMRLTTHFATSEPGCDRQYNPELSRVTLSILIKDLKLNKQQHDKLLQLITPDHYDIVSGRLFISVADFAFTLQNRKRALEIFADLIKECHDPTALEINSTRSDTIKTGKKKRSLDFPMEWLPQRAKN